MKKKKIKNVLGKKAHRLPLASSGVGFTIRTNKENAAKALRRAKAKERQQASR